MKVKRALSVSPRSTMTTESSARFAGVDEFGAAEVADEHGELQAFSVLFHGHAHLAESLGFADVVGNEEPSAGHRSPW